MTGVPATPRRRLGTTLAITSGKGGVGKTSVTINLAVALAAMKRRVQIIDADFALGNVDVMLGLTPAHHLGAFLAGEKSLEEIAVDGPSGVRVVPAGSGVRALTALAPAQWQRVAEALDAAAARYDFVLVDTAAGVADNVIELVSLAGRAIVVTARQPAAVVDAYAMIKLLTTGTGADIGIVVNDVRDGDEAYAVFRQLDAAADRFLGVRLRFDGFIVNDPALTLAVLEQRPVAGRVPETPSSRCFRRLALRLSSFTPLGPRPGAAKCPPPRPTVVPEELEKMEAPRCA